MKIKHTPGPAHSTEPFFAEHDQVVRQFIGIGASGAHVGYCSITGCVNEDEARANAGCAWFKFAFGQQKLDAWQADKIAAFARKYIRRQFNLA